MQINGIARQLLSPLQLDTGAASSALNSATDAVREKLNDLVPAASGSSFHEILSHYDVGNTTPREFSNLIQELHESGEIGDEEFRELARMRLELEQAGHGPDDTVDLLNFFENKLRDQIADLESLRERATPEVAASLDENAATAEAKRQLEWVRKFALIQASGAEAVDVGA